MVPDHKCRAAPLLIKYPEVDFVFQHTVFCLFLIGSHLIIHWDVLSMAVAGKGHSDSALGLPMRKIWMHSRH